MIRLRSQTTHRHALLPIQRFMFIYCHTGALYETEQNKWFYFINNWFKQSKQSTIPEPPPEETSNYPSHGFGIMAAHFFFLMTFIKRSPTIKALIHWNRQVCFLFSPDRPDINNGFIVAMRENEAKGNRTFRQWWTTQTDVENLDAHSLLMCWWVAESDFQS